MPLIPFIQLRPIAADELGWIVRFFRSIHSDGTQKRLNRLEVQVKLTIDLAKFLAERVHLSKHEAILARSEEAKEKLKSSSEKLARCLKIQDESDRVAKMFLIKRQLLNVIWFFNDNEPELTKPRLDAMELVENLIEEDISDWRDIVDNVQTMMNHNDLNWTEASSKYTTQICNAKHV